jgi:hypothetical protein
VGEEFLGTGGLCLDRLSMVISHSGGHARHYLCE